MFLIALSSNWSECINTTARVNVRNLLLAIDNLATGKESLHVIKVMTRTVSFALYRAVQLLSDQPLTNVSDRDEIKSTLFRNI